MYFDPSIHHRRSIRLKGYDYSWEGLYFITICTQNRESLFGTITSSKMNLNDVGKIVDLCWLEIPNHFQNVKLHAYVIMPNHIHGIIEIKRDIIQQSVGAENFLPLQIHHNEFQKLIPRSIGSVVKGFKIGVSKMAGTKKMFYGPLWQRNYYERIIRDQLSYLHISEYIRNNPLMWELDEMHENHEKD